MVLGSNFYTFLLRALLFQSNMSHLITTKNGTFSSAIRTCHTKRRGQFLKSIRFNAFCSVVVLTKPQSISPARKSLLPLSASFPLISREIKEPCPLGLREDFVLTTPSLLSFDSTIVKTWKLSVLILIP